MAYTQSDLDALDLALAAAGRGERVTDVRLSDGSSTRFADTSVADLLTLRDRMARGVAAAALAPGVPRAPRAFRMTLSSGY